MNEEDNADSEKWLRELRQVKCMTGYRRLKNYVSGFSELDFIILK